MRTISVANRSGLVWNTGVYRYVYDYRFSWQKKNEIVVIKDIFKNNSFLVSSFTICNHTRHYATNARYKEDAHKMVKYYAKFCFS